MLWTVEGNLILSDHRPIATCDDEDVLLVLADMAMDRGMSRDAFRRATADWPVKFVYDGPFEAMEGETLLSMETINRNTRLVIHTDGGRYEWETWGDCCAEAVIAEFPTSDDIAAAIGLEIVRWDIGEVTQGGGYSYVVDTQFYTLHVGREMLQFSLRTTHNGYYGGTLEMRECPHRLES